MRIHRAGERAFLIEDETLTPEQLRATVCIFAREGMISVVGHSSILVFMRESEIDETAILQLIEQVEESSAAVSLLHRIEVAFGGEHGPELSLLLTRAEMDRQSFLGRIEELELTVRYLGFRPGFAYLDGWPVEWQLPRRAESRVSVPGGTFAIAGSMAAFYPSASPGGWNLLGRTAERFWNPLNQQPNLLGPGDRIRIAPVEVLSHAMERTTSSASASDAICRIESPGIATYVVDAEDLSRCTLGLAAGGAFDESLRERLNARLNNPIASAALECTARGPRIRFLSASRLAWGGAAAEVRKNGELVDTRRVFSVESNDLVEIGTLHGSLRGLLAFEKGVRDPSSPPYALTRRLQRGDILASEGTVHNAVDASIAHRNHGIQKGDPFELVVIVGPHETDPAELERFLGATWIVSVSSDRTGIRLRSETIDHRPAADLPSCGAQCGTIQWHPNGEIVILGPDHPVTGGYHQVATLLQSERWKLARLMPGESVRLVADRSCLSAAGAEC